MSLRYSEAVHRHLEGVWNMLVRCMEQVSCTLKLSVRCLGFIVFFCGTAGTDRTRQVSIKSYTAGWCPVGD